MSATLSLVREDSLPVDSSKQAKPAVHLASTTLAGQLRVPTTGQSSHEGQVSLPRSFFQKSKTEYRDWRWAMVRELIQNSYDAGAATIHFHVDYLPDGGPLLLEVADDGSGMNEDTLINVLLCLGGTKKGSGAIGGKGYAKTILFFAHHWYEIHTGDLVVKGIGGSYSLTRGNDPVVGTKVRIALDDANDQDSRLGWMARILAYVRECFMGYTEGNPVEIRLNNVTLPQNDREYAVALDTPLGHVWYDEVKSTCSTFVVSVNGLPMFTERYVGVDKTCLAGGLNLTSSEHLTSNRDGFDSQTYQAFSELMARLVNERSVLRFGRRVAVTLNPSSRAAAAISPTEQPDSSPSGNPEHESRLSGSDSDGGTSDEEGHLPLRSDYPQDFLVTAHGVISRKSAATESYLTLSGLLKELNLARSSKLSKRWQAMVKIVLCCDWSLANGVNFATAEGVDVTDWESFDGDLVDLIAYKDRKKVGVGFCFIPDTRGMCAHQKDVTHLMINPLMLTTDSNYRTLDALDVAIHECTHLWNQYHSEDFIKTEIELRQSVRRWLSVKELVKRIESY